MNTQAQQLLPYLNNPNVRAMLDLIAQHEVGAGGYGTVYGGKRVTDLSRHPNIRTTTAEGTPTSAAGRYQFQSGTYSEAARALGLRDFSAQSQDLAAVYLLKRRGTLDQVARGDLRGALPKLTNEWAGLRGVSGMNQQSPIQAALARNAIFGGRDFSITSQFGYRGNIGVAGASKNHNGIDLAAPRGTPIYAPEDGVVGGNQTQAGGNQMWLNSGNGYRFGFAHLDRYAVPLGSAVKKGQLIGYTGNTGIGSGPHLHFTVTDPKGNKIDPSKFALQGSAGSTYATTQNGIPAALPYDTSSIRTALTSYGQSVDQALAGLQDLQTLSTDYTPVVDMGDVAKPSANAYEKFIGKDGVGADGMPEGNLTPMLGINTMPQSIGVMSPISDVLYGS